MAGGRPSCTVMLSAAGTGRSRAGRVPGLASQTGLPRRAGALAGSIRASAARRVHEKCMRSAWQVYGRRIRAAGP